MHTSILKKLLMVSVICSLFVSITLAQSEVPSATVVDGGLDLDGDGVADILTPTGAVIDGGLDLDENGVVDVPTPVATVLPDGSLDTGTEVLPVPHLPVTLFFKNLFQYTNPEQAGWFYSNIINHFWDGASVGSSGWIFWEDWGIQDANNGWFYVNTSVGSEEGWWSYSNFLNSWCYFWVGGDGFKRISDGADFQVGWFYVDSPPSGSNWYFYDQYNADWAGGARVCLISNDNGTTWIRLR